MVQSWVNHEHVTPVTNVLGKSKANFNFYLWLCHFTDSPEFGTIYTYPIWPQHRPHHKHTSDLWVINIWWNLRWSLYQVDGFQRESSDTMLCSWRTCRQPHSLLLRHVFGKTICLYVGFPWQSLIIISLNHIKLLTESLPHTPHVFSPSNPITGRSRKADSWRSKIYFNLLIYLMFYSSYCHNIWRMWSVITMIGRLHFENIMNICKIGSEENEFAKIYFRASAASFSRRPIVTNIDSWVFWRWRAH